jgi:hypothetical protein
MDQGGTAGDTRASARPQGHRLQGPLCHPEWRQGKSGPPALHLPCADTRHVAMGLHWVSKVVVLSAGPGLAAAAGQRHPRRGRRAPAVPLPVPVLRSANLQGGICIRQLSAGCCPGQCLSAYCLPDGVSGRGLVALQGGSMWARSAWASRYQARSTTPAPCGSAPSLCRCLQTPAQVRSLPARSVRPSSMASPGHCFNATQAVTLRTHSHVPKSAARVRKPVMCTEWCDGCAGSVSTAVEGEDYIMCVSPYPHINNSPTNTCLYWIGPYADGRFDLQRAKGATSASLAPSPSPSLAMSSATTPHPMMIWTTGRVVLFSC